MSNIEALGLIQSDLNRLALVLDLDQTEKQTWNYRPMGSNPIQEIQEIHEQFMRHDEIP